MLARKFRAAWPSLLIMGVAALALLALGRALSDPPAAYGQVPDAGKQREIMIKELQAQNERLTEIAGLLREIRDRQPAPPKPTKP